MKKATLLAILLSVALVLVSVSLTGKERKQKKWQPTLVPVPMTPSQQIVRDEHDPTDFKVVSTAGIYVAASGLAETVPAGVGVFVHGDRLSEVGEIWLHIGYYAALAPGQKPDFPLSDYVVDTTGVQVIDSEGAALARASLADMVNEILDAAQAGLWAYNPPAPLPPPVGSPSTYYIDCFGGYQYYGYGTSTSSASCQATPDNGGAQDAYAAQQAGHKIGLAIRAWRVSHHNRVIQRETRELLVFFQNNYLRDRVTFSGSDLVQPKPEWRHGLLVYRRTDGRKPVSPITVRVPLPDLGAGSDTAGVFTFRFVDAP